MKKIMTFFFLFFGLGEYVHAQPEVSTQDVLSAMQRSMDMNKKITDINKIYPFQDTIYCVSADGINGRFHIVQQGERAIPIFRNFIKADSIQAYNTEATIELVGSMNEIERIACNIENHFLYTASTLSPVSESKSALPVDTADVSLSRGYIGLFVFGLFCTMFVLLTVIRKYSRFSKLPIQVYSPVKKEDEESWIGI